MIQTVFAKACDSYSPWRLMPPMRVFVSVLLADWFPFLTIFSFVIVTAQPRLSVTVDDLQVHDRRVIDGFNGSDTQPRSVDLAHRDTVQPKRIRPIL